MDDSNAVELYRKYRPKELKEVLGQDSVIKIIEGKLYGLGSNDAGGCLVSLLATFCYFYDKEEERILYD